MEYQIKTTKTFDKEAKRLKKRYVSLGNDIARLVDELLKNPETGASLGGGLRKVWLSIESKGKGKRGGGHVITFTVVTS